ncbi:XRE family transcriptional regulator [Edaphobacter paludis]|uniref:XRE family transcriptional regulator n=1 Tax=Edaphobacter paludis TaxID=3035702 RepID=A0AAU7D6F0_9BACT
MAIKWNDLNHKNSPEKREAIRHEAKDELERIGFGKLRQARQLTQVQLAERLDVPQAAISRMERRTDLLLSTLREYVEGMGGQLELRATFPEGGEFLLDPLVGSLVASSARKRMRG